MKSIAVMPRILGALFYYSPQRPEIAAIIEQINSIPELYHWQKPEAIASLCFTLIKPDLHELSYQFSVLFEGQGEMVAPPWGSVYQNKEHLLMGDSTVSYRLFLAQQGISLNSGLQEPEDQFGLMLLTLTLLLEREDEQAAIVLLELHLLPWAFRYLELLTENQLSPFYSGLAEMATYFLQDVEKSLELKPAKIELFL